MTLFDLSRFPSDRYCIACPCHAVWFNFISTLEDLLRTGTPILSKGHSVDELNSALGQDVESCDPLIILNLMASLGRAAMLDAFLKLFENQIPQYFMEHALYYRREYFV